MLLLRRADPLRADRVQPRRAGGDGADDRDAEADGGGEGDPVVVVVLVGQLQALPQGAGGRRRLEGLGQGRVLSGAPRQ